MLPVTGTSDAMGLALPAALFGSRSVVTARGDARRYSAPAVPATASRTAGTIKRLTSLRRRSDSSNSSRSRRRSRSPPSPRSDSSETVGDSVTSGNRDVTTRAE